jgi:uncharacterized protein (TIGR03437 family)
MSKVQYSLLLALPMILGSASTAYASATLAAAPSTVALTYTQPSSPSAQISDVLTLTATSGANNTFFTVGAFPPWLTVTQSGTLTGSATSATATVNFQANISAGAMVPGTYSANVIFTAGTATATVTVTLAIKAAPGAAGFNCIPTINPTLNWPVNGQNVTVPVTCSTNGEESAFTVSFSGPLAPAMQSFFGTNQTSSGIAYSWGTTETVTIPYAYLQQFSVTNVLMGTATFTPNNGATPVAINITITIAAPTPTLTGFSITELPVDASNNHTVVVTGSGFLQGSTRLATSATSGGTYVVAPNWTTDITVASPNTLIWSVDKSLLASAGSLYVKVSNTSGGWIAMTPSVVPLTVTGKPIIYSITNAASFSQPAAGAANAYPTVSPYEIISIFGANFDPGSTAVEVQTVGGTANAFGTSLNNSAGAPVTVTFYEGGGTTPFTVPGLAPVIFVSNNQINAIVPVGIDTKLGTNLGTSGGLIGANVVVTVTTTTTVDTTTTVTALSNDVVYYLNTVAATPGIFTPGGSGQGVGAVLNQDWTLNGPSNPNPKGNWMHIYLTGLGEPPALQGATLDVAPGNAVVTTAAPVACVSAANYLKVLTGVATYYPPLTAMGTAAGSLITGNSSLTAIDGAVFTPNYFWSGSFPPCFGFSTSATTAGVQVLLGTNATPLNVQYAGFPFSGVAGLYQIDAQVPASGYTYAPTVASGGGSISLSVSVNTVGSANTSATTYSAATTYTTQAGVIVYVQ